MVSNIWNGAVYDVSIGGFNNNLHCLARCVSAVVGGIEYTRVEREQRINSLSNGHTDELQEAELPSRVSAEANIKSSMQIYVKLSAGIVLDSWNDNSRPHIVPKLIFLDQLCELSPYLPRSTLEVHIPYTILRSIYHQLYGASLMASEPMEQSPRQSPLISLAHASPSARQNRPETTPRSHTFEPSYYSSSGSQHDDGYDADRRTGQLRSMRRSGPLDFSASRKVKLVEGSSSGSSHGAGSLQRFAMSRSGPLSYK
ncbi:probable protein NAP1 [Miscanthus floridulus]|uniref:probable protein NAP1 n=1 Tax=Miscanthus floridulus TaxID=154761 RepID=UPI0034577A8F